MKSKDDGDGWRATSNNVGQDMQDLRLSQCPRLYSCRQATHTRVCTTLDLVLSDIFYLHTHTLTLKREEWLFLWQQTEGSP